MDVFKLFGEIIINDGEVVSKLNKIDSKAKSTGGVFEKIGNSVVQGFGLFAGGAIFSKITDGLSSAATMGMDFNNSMEQAKTNFTTFLGSAEKADSLLGDLSKMAKNTPFELEDLTKGSQALLNYGDSVEKNVEHLTRLGDISMGNKEKLGGLVTAFGQVKGNGRLMGEELNQMIERGFNPLQVMSKETGKSMATLREEMGQGKISFEMVEKAIVTATSSGGQFYKSMENSSKTFSGQMSTLRDNLSQTFGKILEPIFTRLSTVILPILNGSFDLLNSRVGQYMPVIKQYIVSAITTAGNIIDWLSKNVMPTLNNAFNYIRTNVIPPLVTSFQTWIPQIVNIIQSSWAIIQRLTAIFGPYIRDIFTNTFNAMRTIVGGLITTLQGLLNFVQGVLTGNWSKAWNGIKQVFSGVFSSLSGIVKNNFNGVIAMVNQGIRALNKLSFKLPQVMGGSTVGLSISQIPYLAHGGDIVRGGSAIVGEAGPELINLPRGASVTPLNKNSGLTLVINNPKFFNQSDIDAFMNPIIKRLKTLGV